MIAIINPFEFLHRGNDAKRQQDLIQMRNSLETYYSDNSLYPSSMSYGQSLILNDAVYMKELPHDPSCEKANDDCSEYIYVIDETNPQWFVLLSKLKGQLNSVTTCPYICDGPSMTLDVSGYNYCVYGGSVDSLFCRVLVSTPTPAEPTPTGGIPSTPSVTPTSDPVSTSTPTPTPTVGPTPTFTPTPTPIGCPGGGYYYCGCSAHFGACKRMDSGNPPPGLVFYCEPGCLLNGVYQCNQAC